MKTHIITLENVCGEYSTHIASQRGMVNKTLHLINYVTPSRIEVRYQVLNQNKVIYHGENIDEAIQAYNNIS